tara:strand:+ start:2850 stop:4814 length:1965 start_codon:yes stop_codon:yes gene_type:complete
MEADGILIVEEEKKKIELPKPSKVQSDLQKSESNRVRFSRVWDMCSLFLQGKQHIQFDKSLNGFTGIRTTAGKQRVTINLILNIYRNIVAKLSLAYPSVTIVPASPSAEDITKAQASEVALKYYWVAQDVKLTVKKAIEWLCLTGNVAIHTYYDPQLDDIRTEAISPYDIFFEPDIASTDESRWVAIRRKVHKKELEQAYPEHAEFIRKQGQSSSDQYRPLQFLASGISEQDQTDTVLIYEVYSKNGNVGVLLNGKYIFEDTCVEGIVPVEFINYTNIPGRVWGVGLVEPLIELQTLYNRARGQVVENAELMGNPKWMVPKTAGLSKNALSDSRPGEKVYYNANAGPAPAQVAMAPLPGYMLDNVRQLSSEMYDVSGVHSTSLGKRAIGIESGAAIEALSSRDLTQLQTTQNQIEEAFRNIAKVVLVMMKHYYDEPRMMKMMDETGKIAFHNLSSTDIVSNPEVHIETGSLFRDEKKDRDQRTLEYLQLGLISRETAMQELQFKTGGAFVTKKMQALSHARDMLHAVLHGHQIEVMPTDDLEAFSQVFSEYMQTKQYYDLDRETQDYIRDVLVSIVTFGRPDADAQRALLEDTVFPRSEPDPQQLMQQVASLGATASQQQQLDKFQGMQQRRAQADGEAFPEQGNTMSRMGGGG